MIDDIIEEKWVITRKIGRGTFSRLFIADTLSYADEDSTLANSNGNHTNNGDISTAAVPPPATVAVKVQPRSTASVLRWEAEVLKGVAGLENVPKFYAFGSSSSPTSQPANPNSSRPSSSGSGGSSNSANDGNEKYDYIVMEHLKGEDMSRLRDRVRGKAGYIALPIVVYLIQQMLTCVRQLHDAGYVHRDIKPANFVRRSMDGTTFAIVDFGLSKLHRDANGVRQQREDVGFRGTRVYASPHAHNKDDLCPRDDLYSVLIVLIDLWCGELPWSEANKNKEYDAITALKRQWLVEDTAGFGNWIARTVTKNCEGKGPQVFAEQCTPQAVSKVVELMEYLKV
jgi:serine/threonine protein kinase